MKTIKEMIDVMQAYERGEQIQYYDTTCEQEQWIDVIKEPKWYYWPLRDYRVKPKSKYVPFESAEEFLEAQRKHGSALFDAKSQNICYCYANCDSLVCTTNGHVYEDCTLQEIFENYIFCDDSTPCGKEVVL